MAIHTTRSMQIASLFLAMLLALPVAAAERQDRTARTPKADRPTGNPISMALDLPQGRIFRYEHRMEQETRQELGGKTTTQQQDMVMGMLMQVLERTPEGLAKIRLTYDYLKITKGTPGSTFTFDSRNPEAVIPQDAKALAAMAGQSITMTIQTDGQVTKVDGAEALIDRILDEMGDQLKPEHREPARKQMEQLFGEHAMIERVAQIMRIYPDRPVDNGDAWSQTFNLTLGMPSIVSTQWTLLRHDGKTARIAAVSDVDTNHEAPPVQLGPYLMSYNLGGTQDGWLEIDRETGWVIAADIDQTMSGTVTVSVPQRGEQVIPQRIHSRLVIVEVDEQCQPVR